MSPARPGLLGVVERAPVPGRPRVVVRGGAVVDGTVNIVAGVYPYAPRRCAGGHAGFIVAAFFPPRTYLLDRPALDVQPGDLVVRGDYSANATAQWPDMQGAT